MGFFLPPDFDIAPDYCPGPSEVTVILQLAIANGILSPNATAKTSRLVARVRFRVLQR
jgi:hypothetical protein